MRILFLGQRVPYPPDRGDKITTFHEIRHLAQNHEVAVACLADGPEDLENVVSLKPLTSSVDAVPLNRRRARIRAVAALVTGDPLTVAYFNERELHRRVTARLENEPVDLIVVYSSGMAQFVQKYAHVPRIMQFADLDSLKWQQYSTSAALPMRWIYGLEYRRLLRYERQLAAEFSHSLVCTPREVRDFVQLIPGAPVSCVSNGVDLDYFQPLTLLKQDNSLVFTGIMDYFPNVEGVVWFCREVLPLIRREVPHVTFTICGARPNTAVQALQKYTGVTVTGRVAEVRPYLARSSVCVVPLRIARGIQNKLLEAMAMGLPTVASTASFEGVEAEKETHLLVADEPADFARSVVRLLNEEALRTRMGRAARVCMEANYRWETQLSRLDQVIAAVTAKEATQAAVQPAMPGRALL
jgi:sugar transferase (PEP-CTERM/EpsH1 system associated)